MHPDNEWLTFIAALLFGVVVGWVTYRTLRHATVTGLSDIATVIGAIGGAAITGLFPLADGAFNGYCIGLFLGFFLYFRTARDPHAPAWMGGPKPGAGGGGGVGPQPGLGPKPGVPGGPHA
ncbi:MAG TPA: hypothetical protein VF092_13785 [Longimicrobium sp.]